MSKTTKITKSTLNKHILITNSSHDYVRKSTAPIHNKKQLTKILLTAHNQDGIKEQSSKVALQAESRKIQNFLLSNSSPYGTILGNHHSPLNKENNVNFFNNNEINNSENDDSAKDDENISFENELAKRRFQITKLGWRMIDPFYKNRALNENLHRYKEELNRVIFNAGEEEEFSHHKELKTRIRRISVMSSDKKNEFKDELMFKIGEGTGYRDTFMFETDKETKTTNVVVHRLQRLKTIREYARGLRKVKKIDSDSLSDDEEDDNEEEVKKRLIYPNSLFKHYLDLTISILTLYTILSSPIYLAFTQQRYYFFLLFDLIVDMLFLFDCLINFFIPYVDTDNDTLIVSHKKIAIEYLITWFCLDFLAGLPISSISALISPDDSKVNLSAVKITKFQRLMRITSAFKVLKLLFKKSKESSARSFMFPKSVYYIGVFFFYFLLISHVLTCFWIYIGNLDLYPNWIDTFGYSDSTDAELYLHSLYYNWVTIFTIGYGDITAKNSTERVFTIIIMMFGLISYSFALSSLGNLLTSYDSFTQTFIDHVGELQSVRRNHHIPDNLYIKIVKFLNYDYKNNKNEKYEFLNELPVKLKYSLIHSMYNEFIYNFRFLKVDNDDFRSRVIFCLRPIQYARKDYVLCENEYMEEFILVRRGILNILLGPNYGNKLIMKLSRYEHFGDILILAQQRSPVSLRVSTETADLFIINKKDLIAISSDFPAIFDKITVVSTYNYIVMLEIMKNKIDEIEKDKLKEFIKINSHRSYRSNNSNNQIHTFSSLIQHKPVEEIPKSNSYGSPLKKKISDIKFNSELLQPINCEIMNKFDKTSVELINIQPVGSGNDITNTTQNEREYAKLDSKVDSVHTNSRNNLSKDSKLLLSRNDLSKIKETNSFNNSSIDVTVSVENCTSRNNELSIYSENILTSVPADLNAYLRGVVGEKLNQMEVIHNNKFGKIVNDLLARKEGLLNEYTKINSC
jgi:hypothetical protein